MFECDCAGLLTLEHNLSLDVGWLHETIDALLSHRNDKFLIALVNTNWVLQYGSVFSILLTEMLLEERYYFFVISLEIQQQ